MYAYECFLNISPASFKPATRNFVESRATTASTRRDSCTTLAIVTTLLERRLIISEEIAEIDTEAFSVPFTSGVARLHGHFELLRHFFVVLLRDSLIKRRMIFISQAST
ncbi:uncharacterized protein LOC113562673 [Ooceraea biroi]|uniref:uncharacterized protein LOC113562673 n=1 Tax=Ooceraea biroi TaxID=2015173 RepID=UPI000F096CE1|nr:uncharacterized protein LOC113562673 [Ooceraea biroi]